MKTFRYAFRTLAILGVLTIHSPTHGQSVVPPQGMISWWPGDGNAYDLQDVNSGDIIRAVTYVPGKVGQAFSFSTSGVVISDSPMLTNIVNTFTVEFWVWPTRERLTTVESTTGTVGTKTDRQSFAIAPEHGGSAGPAGMGVSVGTNGISVFEHAAAYLPSLLVFNSVITNWTHVAVVYENKLPRLYVNGILVRNGLGSLRSTVFPSKRLGNIGDNGQFKGFLDEVSLYNRALSEDEIQAIHAAGSAGKSKPPLPESMNLVANGSFELPVVTSSLDWEHMPTNRLAPWQTIQTVFELWRGFHGATSAKGVQDLELMPGGTNGAIWQTVPTIPGKDYTFSFYHSPRPGVPSRMTVWLDSAAIATFNEDGTGLTNFNWQKFTTNFTATASSITLMFSDEVDEPFRGQGSHIDDVIFQRLILRTGIRKTGPSEIECFWPSVIGRSYQVQYRDRLDDVGWTNLGPVVEGNGGIQSVTQMALPDLPQLFYRVVMLGEE